MTKGRARAARGSARKDVAAPIVERKAGPRRIVSAATAWLPPLLLVAMGVAVYLNSFAGAFILDDKLRIVDSPQIRQLWPLWQVMAQSNRPMLELSLALNYAIGGLNPFSYHAFNLAVHLTAGLVLYGIVRRMLESESMRDRYGGASRLLALAVAGIWLVHPLQTASVTYVIQRAESLMGLCYLLTLYCGMRTCGSPHPRAWIIAAVVVCALGMATKEVMVTAPLLMLLYDRTFTAHSFGNALRVRRGLYAGLAATWLVLVASLANAPVGEEQSWLVTGLNSWNYALTQCEVVVHYLRLALWPSPLVFDYGWPIAESMASVAPAAFVLLVLLACTLLALKRRMWQGFWGAWFFLVLAPTSSIMPIADIAFEHRMYLPLAAVVVILVVGGHDLLVGLGRAIRVPGAMRGGLEVILTIVIAVALGYTTIRRNVDYRSELAMWSDTVAKRPGSARAHLNLGLAIKAQGNLAEAVPHYNEALRLKPDFAEAHNNLGNALAIQRRFDEAIVHYQEAVRLKPGYAEAHLNWGMTLYNQGKPGESVAHYREATRLNPNHPGAHNWLGIALARQGMLDEAAAEFATAVRLDPGFDWARENLRKVEAVRSRTEGAR